jgi:pimeloyl-ACP methyl ester carboxylesterase
MVPPPRQGPVGAALATARQRSEPRVSWVTVNSATLRVAQAGSGQPLVLVNGFGTRLETWRPFAQRLSQSRHLIMFDVPGAGGWHQSRPPRRMPALAQLVVELCDALGHARVDVLGYSWGGALAQQLARDAPERVRRLVLVASSPGVGGPLPSPGVLMLVSSPLAYLSKTYLECVAPVIFGGEARRGGALSRPDLGRWLHFSPGLTDCLQQMYAISWWTSLPWLHRVTAPTLVVSGTQDPLVPMQNAHLLARRIPGARLELIPGGGHLWMLEHPGASAALVEEFLSGPSLAAAARPQRPAPRRGAYPPSTAST